MTFEQLKYLVAIYQEGTILSVAEKYNITHSAISKSISNLESELGVTLFVRGRNGSIITSEGEKAVELALIILDQYEQLKNVAANSNITDSLHIGMSIYGALYLIPDVVDTFSSEHPNVTLHLSILSIDEIIQGIKRGDINFGLSFFTDKAIGRLDRSLQVRKMFSSPLVAFFSKSSHLAEKAYVTPSDLAQSKLVTQADEFIVSSLSELLKLDEPLKAATYINYNESLMDFVVRNDYVSTTSEAFIKDHIRYKDGSLSYAPIVVDGNVVELHYCYYRQKNRYVGMAENLLTNLIFREAEKRLM